jgi:hypothetical protein
MSDLPELPTRNVIIDGLWEEVRGPYSEDDMRAYALAAVAMERERLENLAKACTNHERSAIAHHVGRWHSAQEWHTTRHGAMCDLVESVFDIHR